MVSQQTWYPRTFQWGHTTFAHRDCSAAHRRWLWKSPVTVAGTAVTASLRTGYCSTAALPALKMITLWSVFLVVTGSQFEVWFADSYIYSVAGPFVQPGLYSKEMGLYGFFLSCLRLGSLFPGEQMCFEKLNYFSFSGNAFHSFKTHLKFFTNLITINSLVLPIFSFSV